MGIRYVFALFLLLTSAGCLIPPETPDTLAEFRKSYHSAPAVSLADKKTLTLAEAHETALLNNPTYRAVRDAVRAARFNYYSSWSAALPEITVQTTAANRLNRGYDLKNPPEGVFPRANRFTTGTSLRATWLLFDGMERELNILIARQELRLEQAANDNVKRLLLRAVSYAFFDIILAAEEKRIHQADLSFQKSSLRQAESRYKNGHVSKATVLNCQILTSQSQCALLDAAYRETVARNALANLLGDPGGNLPEHLNLTPPAPDEKTPGELEVLLEYAVSHRPDLKQSKLRFETMWYKKQKNYAAFLPQIRLFADFSMETYAAKYNGASVHRSYYNQPGFTYGLTGEWNLFRGFHSYNGIRKWQAFEEMARQELDAVFLQVITEVRDAWANCRNSREQFMIYKEIVLYVREQRDLVNSEYWNGRETITRLNGAQSELVAARSRLAAATANLHKAQAQLRAAINRK